MMGFLKAVAGLGNTILEISRQTGGTALLTLRVLIRISRFQIEKRELKKSLFSMGYKSLPIMIATAFVVGVILVIQSFVFVDRYGMRSQLGYGAGFTIVRELGPILLALMFSGRVGAFTAAELGTMAVTEQIDALKCLGIDPVTFLAVPRFIAMIISLVSLTLVGNATALVSASVMGQFMMDVEQHTFWSSLFEMLTPYDFLISVIKSALFGAIIAVNSSYFGIQSSGGAPGVGVSVNKSVVSSAIAIFVVDFFSTFVLG
ncbi:MAG: ABC transporter permease [Deltaproteobacteria bacterium]|nr:ABC transporter permease [Deltaproteobacteria bacterium]